MRIGDGINSNAETATAFANTILKAFDKAFPEAQEMAAREE